ncbi:TetR family transcriptional regulator [Micromonospora yangpuensis]|uniref:Transcriptional regulator, TetR family n=1 Tax=Micromonospora yangpuensis TaxID=683228 RepID=A0A1C6UW39_9ACTN|nr:TetR family transcriptional regulator [Micromonospora yangpuensis]GGM25464.1 TetR family transcriptional regulator [Micromonospora yangpuensis]SCL58304.1 transcriptional regulator, TetR family [Micromonospora yangpuensis]
MRQRARSIDDKQRRSEDLLVAAEAVALERGGVRFVTLAPVTERAGLHRTGVRRYYASKEELLLELAERGWQQWSAAITDRLRDSDGLGPREVALVLADTIASLPVFCDLLTHVTLSLEGDVDIERARQYKTRAFAAYDEIVAALDRASSMTVDQIQALLAAALAFAANFWQVSHPTPTLAALYEQVPEWGHVAFDFRPRLQLLLQSTAVGLAETLTAT